MTDAVPQPVVAELDDPFAQLTGPLADTRKLHFEVVEQRLGSRRTCSASS